MNRKPKPGGHETVTASPYARKLQRKPATTPAATTATGAANGRKPPERKDTGRPVYTYDQHARQPAGRGGGGQGARPLLKRHSRSNLSERSQGQASPRTPRTGSFRKSSPAAGSGSVKQTTVGASGGGGKPARSPFLRHASTNSIQFRPPRAALTKSSSLDDGSPVQEAPAEPVKTTSTPVIAAESDTITPDGQLNKKPTGSEVNSVADSETASSAGFFKEKQTSKAHSVGDSGTATAAGHFKEKHTGSKAHPVAGEQTGPSPRGGKRTVTPRAASAPKGKPIRPPPSRKTSRDSIDSESLRKGYSTVYSIDIPSTAAAEQHPHSPASTPSPTPSPSSAAVIHQLSRVLHSTDEDNIDTERSDSEPGESEDILSSSEEEGEDAELATLRQRGKMFRRGKKKEDTVSRSSSKGSLSSRGSLNESRLKDIQRAFDIFDKNSDGSITREEMSEVLQEADVAFTDEELDRFMTKLDKDGNGTIDYKEFCSMMSDVVTTAMDLEKRMRTAFCSIDVNGDGQISQSELREAMARLGENITENEAAEIVAAIDKNGDQHIDYEEFVTMLYLFNLT